MRIHDGTTSEHQSLTSLIFPTYNPGTEALHETLQKVDRFLQTAPGRWEVLFVSDGSTDDSPTQLQDWIDQTGPMYRLVDLGKNFGKGYAVRTGLAEAVGRWRIFTDVDLSYGLDGVLKVAESLWDGQPAVVGSRLLHDSSFIVPAWLQDYAYYRRLQSSVYSRLVRWLLPIRYSDTQAGLKGFSAEATDALLPLLQCNGFSFDCEVLMACHALDLSVTEVPICFEYFDDYSTTNFKKSRKMVQELLAIRKRFRRLRREMHKPEVAPEPLRKSA